MNLDEIRELEELATLESLTVNQRLRLDYLCRKSNEEGEARESEAAHDPNRGLAEFYGPDGCDF